MKTTHAKCPEDKLLAGLDEKAKLAKQAKADRLSLAKKIVEEGSMEERPASFMAYLQTKVQKSEGLGTIEIVIIIAVLLALALIFREQITAFGQDLMDKVFDSSIIDQIA